MRNPRIIMQSVNTVCIMKSVDGPNLHFVHSIYMYTVHGSSFSDSMSIQCLYCMFVSIPCLRGWRCSVLALHQMETGSHDPPGTSPP